MIDLSKYSNLDSGKKDQLQTIVNLALTTNNITALRNLAINCFDIISPNINKELLLGPTKDFRTIGGTVQDALAGLHVYRTLFAILIHEARCENDYTPSHPFVGLQSIYKELFDTMTIDGIVLVPNFLSGEDNKTAIEKINKFPIAISKAWSNIIAFIDDKFLWETLNKSHMREIIFALMGYSLDHEEANTHFRNNTFVQKLHNIVNDGDVQKVFHRDTYFPCVKWWYFPEEVNDENGPFVYIPGSHRFTDNLAKFIYDQTISIARGDILAERTYGHEEGSLRVFPNEITDMGWSVKKCFVPANTFVVANTFGFHRRGDVIKEGHRNAIHGSIRLNAPFYC